MRGALPDAMRPFVCRKPRIPFRSARLRMIRSAFQKGESRPVSQAFCRLFHL